MRNRINTVPVICVMAALLMICGCSYPDAGKYIADHIVREDDPSIWEQAADILGLPVERTENLNGFFYEQLPEEVQEVYGQLYTGISERKASFSIRAKDQDHIGKALTAVMNDHPEFFWLTGSARISGFKVLGIWKISLVFNIPEEEIDGADEMIRQAAQEYLASLPDGASEYDKVKAAYEYIVFHTDYGHDSVQDQNIQSVFLHHRSVCAGYARAFKYLLDQAGVWCGFVEGYIADTGEGHAWNIVRIDGSYTYVDPSWGDPTYREDTADAGRMDIIYDYLCMTTDEIQQLRHEADGEIVLPECTDRSYDYYLLHGMYYEGWDPDAVAGAVWNAVNAGETAVFFKFRDFDAYTQALAALFPENGEGLLKGPLQQRMEWDAAASMWYYYSCSDELQIIKIFW